MEINNFDKIYDFLDFKNIEQDEFYSVYVVSRGKDQEKPTIAFNIIKAYYIYSLEDLKNKKEEIIKLCEFFNARAYIDVCKRTRKHFLLKLVEEIFRSLVNETTENFETLFETACKHSLVKNEKTRWVVDIDTDDEDILCDIKNKIKECYGYEQSPIVAQIPTVHGFHIITKPFRKRKFIEMCDGKINVLEYAFTLLYFNKKD